jgi:hypothetical protein
VTIGTTLRIVAPAFDTVIQVVAARNTAGGWQLHGRLLTLQLVQAARGVFVAARA